MPKAVKSYDIDSFDASPFFRKLKNSSGRISVFNDKTAILTITATRKDTDAVYTFTMRFPESEITIDPRFGPNSVKAIVGTNNINLFTTITSFIDFAEGE